MTYRLHIEREAPIQLDEWKAVVDVFPELRLDEGPTTISNPLTSAVITIAGQVGTAAMILEGQWVQVFNWNRGKVSFNAPPVTSSPDPVMAEAWKIATLLAAGVRGDEGETYEGPR